MVKLILKHKLFLLRSFLFLSALTGLFAPITFAIQMPSSIAAAGASIGCGLLGIGAILSFTITFILPPKNDKS